MTDTASCVYCQATGPAGHFEPIGNAAGNLACRQTNLCSIRQLAAEADPVYAVLTLVRELVKVHDTDVQGRMLAGEPGSTERRDYRPMISDADLARVHVVLDAASRLVPGWGSSARALEQARAEYGCRTCGAIGRDECTTSGGNPVPRTHGTWGPRWHAGRTL